MLTSYQRRVYLYGAIGVHNSLADLRQDAPPPHRPSRFLQRQRGENRAVPRDLLQDDDLARADFASGCQIQS
jgi:hypothetical protein